MGTLTMMTQSSAFQRRRCSSNSTHKKVIRLRTLAARADNSTLKKLLFLGTIALFAVLALLTLTPGSEACERRRLMLHWTRFGNGPKKAPAPKFLQQRSGSVHSKLPCTDA